MKLGHCLASRQVSPNLGKLIFSASKFRVLMIKTVHPVDGNTTKLILFGVF